MSRRTYPVIIVKGHFPPLGFFYRNRNSRNTIAQWKEILDALKQITKKEPYSRSEKVDSYEVKVFDGKAEQLSYIDGILRADSCASDTHSIYKVISGKQIVDPEAELVDFLKEYGRVPNAEKGIFQDVCFVDYMDRTLTDNHRCGCGVICRLRLQEDGEGIVITLKDVSDNRTHEITPEELIGDRMLRIWEAVPVHPYILERNTPGQKHLRWSFDTIEEARREMQRDYSDRLRDKSDAALMKRDEKLIEIHETNATVRWNRNLEYTWRIYDRRNPNETKQTP